MCKITVTVDEYVYPGFVNYFGVEFLNYLSQIKS